MSFGELLNGFDVIRRIIEGICCHTPNYWKDYILKTRPFFQNVNFGQNINQKGTLIFWFFNQPCSGVFFRAKGFIFLTNVFLTIVAGVDDGTELAQAHK